MNVDQWIETIEEAFKLARIPFTKKKKELLLANQKSKLWSTEVQTKVMFEMRDAMYKLFFNKATNGETFGSIDKVKIFFGKSLQENYHLTVVHF